MPDVQDCLVVLGGMHVALGGVGGVQVALGENGSVQVTLGAMGGVQVALGNEGGMPVTLGEVSSITSAVTSAGPLHHSITVRRTNRPTDQQTNKGYFRCIEILSDLII